MKEFYVSKKHILGAVAQWAVRQSPYNVPAELETVLWKLSATLDASNVFVTNEFAPMPYEDIRAFLSASLNTISEYRAWNERKNGNQAEHKFISRYEGKGDPDDDFIDLDALVRNVANTLAREDSERGMPEILGREAAIVPDKNTA